MGRFANRMMNHENRNAEGNTDYPEVARHQGRAAKSFTLVELLVVIVIIALLAAMLMPVFSRVRGRAERVQCANNLKQLALAFIMYEGEFNEYPPISNTWNTVNHWTYAIPVKYLGGDTNATFTTLERPKIMRCPTAIRYSDPPDWVQKNWSYSMNAWLDGERSTTVTCPAETAMVMDGGHPRADYWDPQEGGGASSPFMVHDRVGGPRFQTGSMASDVGTPGMINVAYTDGHVASLRNTQVPVGSGNFYFFWKPHK